MIDGGSCANSIAKIAFEKMGLKAEPHPHLHNVNWVDKTAWFITQRCEDPIHIYSCEDHVYCDILDIDAAHILLGRPCLYNLDVISLGRSNTYEFKFNRKKIVLKSTKPKSSVGNTKERTVTEKNDKTPC